MYFAWLIWVQDLTGILQDGISYDLHFRWNQPLKRINNWQYWEWFLLDKFECRIKFIKDIKTKRVFQMKKIRSRVHLNIADFVKRSVRSTFCLFPGLIYVRMTLSKREKYFDLTCDFQSSFHNWSHVQNNVSMKICWDAYMRLEDVG